MALERVYLPESRCPALKTKLKQHKNSISKTLYAEGIKCCVTNDYQISARGAEGVERLLLDCPTYTPILDVRSVRTDDHGLVQYTELSAPSDRVEYSVDLTDPAMTA